MDKLAKAAGISATPAEAYENGGLLNRTDRNRANTCRTHPYRSAFPPGTSKTPARVPSRNSRSWATVVMSLAFISVFILAL